METGAGGEKMELTLDRVYQAAHVLKPLVKRTELVRAAGIETDCELYLKTENLQNTGSFKIRGACYPDGGGEKEGRRSLLGRKSRAGRRPRRLPLRHEIDYLPPGGRPNIQGGGDESLRGGGEDDRRRLR